MGKTKDNDMNLIIQNSAICGECFDEIYSKHRHDYRSCGCGSVTVDGGNDYIRRRVRPNIKQWWDSSIFMPPEKIIYTPGSIISKVAREFDVRLRDLVGKQRSSTLVAARHAAIKQLKEKTDLSLREIARVLNMHHSSVIHALQKESSSE